MIKSKKELRFYIMADRIMNGYGSRKTVKSVLTSFFLCSGKEIQFLEMMRNLDYHSHQDSFVNKLAFYYYLRKYNKVSTKLGYDICPDCFGYGLVLPHRGTKVVGGGNTIGNYAVLHTSTCITAGHKVIGDGMYLCAGAKVVKDVLIGNNVTISVNTVVNKSFTDSNLMLAGMPAQVKYSNYSPWYVRDGFQDRVKKVEELKQKMGLA